MAALLLWGSAVSLIVSCSGRGAGDAGPAAGRENVVTQSGDSLTIIDSENGRAVYRAFTPLMEKYDFAREPYMEFRKGIDIEQYDSLGGVTSTLVADYAIFFEDRQLWEAKGNVVATNAEGDRLETQQLFWDQIRKIVYSNIDTRITRNGDPITGVGFESDDRLHDWEFRGARGRMRVDTEPNTAAASDSTGG